MAVAQYMNDDMRLREGILSFPPKKDIPQGRHVAYLDKTTGYKHLLVVPGPTADSDRDLWALSFLGLTPRLGDLEAELRGQRVRIKIPSVYLSDVNLWPNSRIRVIRYPTEESRNETEVWRRADIRAYEKKTPWTKISESAMQLGL